MSGKYPQHTPLAGSASRKDTPGGVFRVGPFPVHKQNHEGTSAHHHHHSHRGSHKRSEPAPETEMHGSAVLFFRIILMALILFAGMLLTSTLL